MMQPPGGGAVKVLAGIRLVRGGGGGVYLNCLKAHPANKKLFSVAKKF
jgi:hypothetical protein